MVAWRDKGFVQDSDDEDLDCIDLSASQHGEDSIPAAAFQKETDIIGHESEVTRPGDLSKRQGTAQTDIDVDELQLPWPHDAEAEGIESDRPVQTTEAAVDDFDTTAFDIPSSPLSEPPLSFSSQETPFGVLGPGQNGAQIDEWDRISAFDESLDGESAANKNAARTETSSYQLNAAAPSTLRQTFAGIYIPTPAQRDEINDRQFHRTFRRRNPIQLHPYQLEMEKYRQTLKSRGVQPIKFGNQEMQDGTGESQEQQSMLPQGPIPNGSQASEYEASPAPSVMHSPILGPVSGVYDIPNDDDSFPDLAADGRISEEEASRKGFKKRRLDNSNVPASTTPHVHHRTGFREGDQDRVDSITATSKSRAETRQGKPRRKRFRRPAEIGSNALPTPAISSEPNILEVEAMDFGPDPDDSSETSSTDNQFKDAAYPSAIPDDEQASVLSVSSRSSTPKKSMSSRRSRSVYKTPRPTQPEPDGVETEGDQLKRARKRMRGVLPASWLRLDLKARTQPAKTPTANEATTSPIKSTQQKGVARRVEHRQDLKGPKESPVQVLEVSSDSETGSLIETPTTKKEITLATPIQEKYPIFGLFKDIDDIPEDNDVDAMLPTASRNRSHRVKLKPKRNKQMRLTDGFVQKPRPTVQQPSTNQQDAVRHRNIANSAVKPRRPREPKVSILDVIPTDNQLPDFIKVATRRAKQKKNLARQGPSTKLVSLHSKKDNEDVEIMMNDWKSGKIQQTYSRVQIPKTPKSSRKPLHERQNNEQRRPTSSHLSTEISRRNPPITDPDVGEPLPQQKANPVSKRSKPQQTRLRLSSIKIQPRKHVEPTIQPATKAQTARRTDLLQQLHNSAKRTGQLEDLEASFDQFVSFKHIPRALPSLREGLHHLDQQNATAGNPLLERFLHDENDVVLDLSIGVPETQDVYSNQQLTPRRKLKRKAQKPVQPRDGDDQIFRVVDAEDVVVITEDTSIATNKISLSGLGPYGTTYTVDFGIQHLPKQTYFRADTIVGSGILKRALDVAQVDLDSHRGHITIYYHDRPFRWGPWNEEISVELEELFGLLKADLTTSRYNDYDMTNAPTFNSPSSTSITALRNVLLYLVDSVSFLDAIDRDSFVARWCWILEDFYQAVADYRTCERSSTEHCARILTLLTITTHVTCSIAGHGLVSNEKRCKISSLHDRFSHGLARHVLQDFGQSLRDAEFRIDKDNNPDKAIHSSDVAAEGIVVLNHVNTRSMFWNAVNQSLMDKNPASFSHLQSFESVWKSLFSVVPFLDFDFEGIISKRSESDTSTENWQAVKTMLVRLLEVTTSLDTETLPSLNPYIRACLSRCFNLVSQWGWYRCSSILNVTFDFFARRGLALLPHEESTLATSCLEELSSTVLPQLEPGDRSFSIFLKVLFLGIVRMRSILPDKSVRNAVQRYLPNHGRRPAKEDDLSHEDLQALRNHHDLLAVLYCASPAGFRPKLSNISHLVDYRNAHIEVCRVNIRAWANMVRFELDKDEDFDLQSFAAWYNAAIDSVIALHRQARTEAEDYGNVVGAAVSRQVLEQTIASNQEQVEGLLMTALASLRDVMQRSKNKRLAQELFRNLGISRAFDLFDNKQPRIRSTLQEALKIYEVYFELVVSASSTAVVIADEADDSQDYGEFPLFDEDDISAAHTGQMTQSPHEAIADAVFHFLSNCFGADNFSDEKLLTSVVDTWVRVCFALITTQQYAFAQFLDEYGRRSWYQLRNTDQRRKFTAYFLAKMLEQGEKCFKDDEGLLVSLWMTTLAERESMLKFEHVLTSSMLNALMHNPLLRNLPFSKRSESGRYDIKLDDFKARRLSVVTTVFANMHQTLTESFLESSPLYQEQKYEFSSLLRQFMTTMKSNYKETQQDGSRTGNYVEFVQSVIESMQQYTAQIQPIDRFFTDSNAFPLPRHDQTYVVGRLRSYGLKLGDAKTQKRLATFVLATLERAAADGQHAYLANQLVRAVSSQSEPAADTHAHAHTPTLRLVLLDAVVPALIAESARTPHSAVLLPALLQAAASILDDLLFQFSITDAPAVHAIAATLSRLLVSLNNSILTYAPFSMSASAPAWLCAALPLLEVLPAILPLVDYIHRAARRMPTAVQAVANLARVIGHICATRDESSLESGNAVERVENRIPAVERVENRIPADGWTAMAIDARECERDFTPGPLADLRAFCAAEVRDAWRARWKSEAQAQARGPPAVYTWRAGAWKAVLRDAGWTRESERERLDAACAAFVSVAANCPVFEPLVPARGVGAGVAALEAGFGL